MVIRYPSLALSIFERTIVETLPIYIQPPLLDPKFSINSCLKFLSFFQNFYLWQSLEDLSSYGSLFQACNDFPLAISLFTLVATRFNPYLLLSKTVSKLDKSLTASNVSVGYSRILCSFKVVKLRIFSLYGKGRVPTS